MTDIHDGKESDNALRELLLQYQSTFDNAAVGMSHVGLDGRWLKVNDRLCAMTGYTREELLAATCDDITHPDDVDADRAQARRLVAGEIRTYTMDERYVHKRGSIVWVTRTVSLVHDAKGNPKHFLAMIQDITEHKRTEQELQRLAWLLQPDIAHDTSDQPYGDLTELNTQRLLLDSVGKSLLREVANDYLGLLRTSGAVYECNGDYALGLFTSQWCQFMDRTSRAHCGIDDNHAALRSGRWHCHESCWEASQRSMDTGQPVDLACKGGIRLYAVPIKTADNQVIGSINFGYGDPPNDTETLQVLAERYGVTVETLRTLSEQYESRPPYIIELAKQRLHSSATLLGEIVQRRQTEAALRKSEEQLRNFNLRLEHLVQERTQELVQSQQQLRAMATELNLAEQRERKRLATELHDHLQQTLIFLKLKLHQGKRLAGSVPACTDIMERVDEVLTEVLAYTRDLVAELSPPVLRDLGLVAGLKWLGGYMKRYELAVTVEAPWEEIRTLPDDVATLLFQSVRELLMNVWKHAATGQASVKLEHRERMLHIEVADDGTGFDAAAAVEPSPLGSRFGLFSIRERMQALGGRFILHSVPGNGTTAILIYPLEPDEGRERGQTISGQQGLVTPAASAVVTVPRIRLLIVDDHVMVRQGLCGLLGHFPDVEIVGQASDGVEAVALVEQLQPTVVVMDINMPRMNGIEATTRIKECYPSTIVVGLSFNVSQETRDVMIKAGAAVLLSKEAAVDQLYGVIRKVVSAC